MRYVESILVFVTLAVPCAVQAQITINPTTIQASSDIVLQNTDVYYTPMAPPGSHDRREYLSNRGGISFDPNRRGNYWLLYEPRVYESRADTFSILEYWQPYPSLPRLGPQTAWQRLFHASNKPNGDPSDIRVGRHQTNATWETNGDYGDVIVSPLEDVDFRASGTVKMEDGFHVKPGAFFHAYQDPRWDTTVFEDEFADTVKFRNQWYVYRANGTEFHMPQCEFDSNVALVADPEAEDGHAVDLIMRVSTGTSFNSNVIDEKYPCSDTLKYDGGVPATNASTVSTGYMRACPFPLKQNYTGRTDWAYPHAPYGKYEVRDKVPIIPHHTNNWGDGVENLEWDIGEALTADMGSRQPGFGHRLMFGPYHGYFQIKSTNPHDTLFIIYDDTMQVNDYNPRGRALCVNIGGYHCTAEAGSYVKDTVYAGDAIAFPSEYVNSTDTFECYYGSDPEHVSDSVHWNIYRQGDFWVFSAPFHVIGPDSVYFRRDYQPAWIKIFDTVDASGARSARWHRCHWEASVNTPDQGRLAIDDFDSVHNPVSATSGIESFRYTLPEINTGFGSGFGYIVPKYEAGLSATEDTNAYKSQPYRYHTFAMEYLPHEVRFLYDSVVVRRLPDRLLPTSSDYFDWITRLGRGGIRIIPGEFNGDSGELASYILSHLTNPGVEDVTVGGHSYHAAHHKLDYVKVFDVPSSVRISNFPR